MAKEKKKQRTITMTDSVYEKALIDSVTATGSQNVSAYITYLIVTANKESKK